MTKVEFEDVGPCVAMLERLSKRGELTAEGKKYLREIKKDRAYAGFEPQDVFAVAELIQTIDIAVEGISQRAGLA